MARLSWSVLWTAFAIVAATPSDYGYGNYVQQPQPEIPNADVPTDSGFCAGKENGAYSSGNGCVKDYWLCWNGLSTSQECPLDLIFNEENGQCDYANSIFACTGERTTTQLPADSPTVEPVDYDCSGKEDGDYPYSQDCKVDYVSCVGGVAWARSCPLIPGTNNKLSFDPENRFCDWLEHIVACGGSPPTAADIPELDYECPSPSGSFALVSALCSPTYYICQDNQPSIAVCSDDMIWDDSNKECRMPADTDNCSFDCSGKADAPYSIGCSQNYWWCWEGKASKLACPEGMVFNGENSQCDFNMNVFECTGQRVTPAPAIASDFATPPPVDFDCSTVEDGNHAFQNGAQCQPKFVSCVGGVAWEMTCPDGLLFDPDQELCDNVRRIVACGGSLAEETTTAYYNSYSSYNTPAAPRAVPRKIHKTTLAARSITRGDYYQQKTTPAAEPTTALPSDNYGDYEATTLAERTTTRRHHKTTTLADQPIRRSYYQTTTPAAEPTTELPSDNYGDYEATTLAEPTTIRRRLHKTTTPAAEPTTRRSYYQTTTLADEPTTTTSYDDSYGSFEDTTPAAEPITTTRSSYGQKRTTTLADEPIIRDSYYQKTPAAEQPIIRRLPKPTPAAQPVIRRASYSEAVTPAADQPIRASYSQKKIVSADQPIRASYSQKKIVSANQPRASYSQKKMVSADQPTRASYSQKKFTPAAEQPTRASYSQKIVSADKPRASYSQKIVSADQPRASYSQKIVSADQPLRASYSKKIVTPAAEQPTRASYSQKKFTPAAEQPTRASYSQKKIVSADQPRASYSQKKIVSADQPLRASYSQKKFTPAAEQPTRASYYQTTTPAAEPTTTLDSYSYEASTLADEPITTTRSSYGQKRTTTLADVPIIRDSYYQATAPLADQPTRPVIRRRILPKPTAADQPIIRESNYETTPAAEPATRRTYKLTPTAAEEPITRKPQFKQSSYY